MTETAQETMDRIAESAREWSAQNHAEGGVCDFCCDLLVGKPVVTYITDRALVEQIVGITAGGIGVVDHVSDEYWAACPACDPVIQENDAAKLAQHVFETADYSRIGSPRDSADLPRLVIFYEQFFGANPKRDTDLPEHLTGVNP